MRRFRSSWINLAYQLGFRKVRKSKPRKLKEGRASRIESLEERHLLTGTPGVMELPLLEDAWRDTVAIAPPSFSAGHFTLTSTDWSGKSEAGQVMASGYALGVRGSGEDTNSGGFQPGEYWSFQFNAPGRLMAINFEEFGVEDADKALLYVGDNDPILIAADRVHGGVWRPSEFIEFEAGETLRLVAVAPDVADLEKAEAIYDERTSETPESFIGPIAPFQATSQWKVRGLNVIGMNDSVRGGYINFAWIESPPEQISEGGGGSVFLIDPAAMTPFYEPFNEMGGSGGGDGFDMVLTSFTVEPGTSNYNTQFNFGYEIEDGEIDDGEFKIKVYRSLDGLTPYGEAIFSETVYDSGSGPDNVIVDVDLGEDIQEDYYLIAVIEDAGYEVTVNNTQVFAGGAFRDTTTGIVYFHADKNNDADLIRIDTAGGHKIQQYIGGSYQTIYAQGTDFADIHVRTHGGDDEIDVVTSFDFTLWAFGGTGIDNIYSGVGDDFLSGGFDEFTSDGIGLNTIYGGDGDDVIYGGDDKGLIEVYEEYGVYGGDWLFGGEGDDEIYGQNGPDWIDGGEGNDLIYGGDEDDFGGFAEGYGDYIIGGEGDDVIYGGAGGDTIQGYGGNDYLDGGSGDDYLYGEDVSGGVGGYGYGGYGNNILIGGEGVDYLAGGHGDDIYRYEGSGEFGLDAIIESSDGGTDTFDFSLVVNAAGTGLTLDLISTGTTTVLQGASGALLELAPLFGSYNIEDVIGTSYDDVIRGNSSSNILSGGAGNDLLEGRAGNDTLSGGLGGDILLGGDNNDTLEGDEGNDILYDTVGSNTFDWGQGTSGPRDALLVTTLVDENETLGDSGFGTGDLSLREAIAVAALVSGDDTVQFAGALYATGPARIELADITGSDGISDQLVIGSNLTIDGPGADLFAISGVDETRVISVSSSTTVMISGITITEGRVVDGARGGGIANAGTLTLNGVAVVNNSAYSTGGGGSGGGAGIYSNSPTLTILNSTIANNFSERHGAGIRTHSGNVQIINSTISNNVIQGGYRGGGMYLAGTTSAVVVNSTVTENYAGYRGGGYSLQGDATLEFRNSIVAGNTSAYSAYHDGEFALVETSSYNVFGYINNGSHGVTGSGNTFNESDPGLAPLGYYGGHTQIHALLPDSPAIDAGNDWLALGPGSVPLDFDQRGGNFHRKHGTVDIGAAEANVTQASSVSAIYVYGTDGADGIFVGENANGDEVVTIDSLGGYEFPVDLTSGASLTIYAYGGNDVVNVHPVVDLGADIYGGDGDDLLLGGSGEDILYGGLGADTLYGGAGIDVLYGYLDNYVYLGGDGADSLFGDDDADDDELWVEYGSDLYHSSGGDVVDGENAAEPTADEWDSTIKEDNAGFGAGWDLAAMERLVFDPFDPDFVRWVRPDGYLIDFDEIGEPAMDNNDESASIITEETDYYLRVDKYGNQFHYSKSSANKGALIRMLDRVGVGYEYTYGDHDGDLKDWEVERITRIRPGQDPEMITFEYDSTSRVQWIEDEFGRVTDFVYTLGGQIQQILLPAPDSTAPGVRPTFTFGYDGQGFISSITDAEDRLTEYDFDHVEDLGTGKVTITYDDGGEVIMLPAVGDIYDHWRSQLGGWAEFLPTFKYKFLTGEPEFGYLQEKLDTDIYRTTTFTVNSDGYLTEMVDPAGNMTTYTRNDAGLPEFVTVTASGGGPIVSQTTYTYDDANYNLLRIDYFDGTFETWEYDSMFSQVIEHVDQLGRQTLYDLDEKGSVVEMRVVVGVSDLIEDEGNDLVTLYEYTEDGLLFRVIELRNDTDGSPLLSLVTEYAYTDVNDIAGHTGRWLASITYGGDVAATPGISFVDDSTIAITHNDFGMPATITDEVNRVTTYVYDDLDRLIEVTSDDPGNSQDIPVTQYVYDLSGLLQDEINTWDGGSTPITTHFTYDSVGRLKTIVLDEGGLDAETEYFYDLVGNITEVSNPLEQSTHFTYDVLDRLIRITQEEPEGGGPLTSPVTLLAYDALGRLTATRDPVSVATRREYDLLGRLKKEFGPLGANSSYVYDEAGQLVQRTDPQGRLFSYAYDDAGRLTSVLEPGLTNPTVLEYDTVNNLRFVTDPEDNTTERVYDERGRLTESIDANTHSTLYTYTEANELETLTDANLNTTTWAYDGVGRVASEENDLNDLRTYEYDGLGRLVEYTDRNGRVTTYEYDNLHQLTAEKWWNGMSLVRTISYDFDLVGNLESVSDPSAAYEYAYDDLNRLTSVEQTIAGLTPVIIFEKEYDAAGRRTSSTAEIGGTADYANSYVYDALGRLTSVTQSDNSGNSVNDKRVVFGYSDHHQLSEVIRYASTTTSNLVASSEYSFDEYDRLSNINHSSVGSYAEEFGYTYDGAGRLASFSSLLDSYSVEYAYDARHQLLEADYTGVLTDEVYDYDDNGNRDQDIENFAGTNDYTTGDLNRLTSDDIYTYDYDDEGNRIKRTSASGDYTVYEWDHRNRLTAVLEYDANGTPTNFGDDVITSFVSYTYDAHNQIVGRYFDGDGNIASTGDSTLTGFVYDDGQIVLQFDDAGTLANLGADDLSHRYLWGPAIDMLLADEAIADGETLWAMTDHLGSVRDIVDDNGTLRKHVQYDSFGNVTDEEFFDTAGDPISAAHSEAIAQLFGYTGRVFDRATGLQNNLHRWYDPTIGRWLSEDPIGFAAGDANLYRYVGNAVTVYVDPSGLAPTIGYHHSPGVRKTPASRPLFDPPPLVYPFPRPLPVPIEDYPSEPLPPPSEPLPKRPLTPEEQELNRIVVEVFTPPVSFATPSTDESFRLGPFLKEQPKRKKINLGFGEVDIALNPLPGFGETGTVGGFLGTGSVNVEFDENLGGSPGIMTHWIWGSGFGPPMHPLPPGYQQRPWQVGVEGPANEFIQNPGGFFKNKLDELEKLRPK